MFLQDIWQESSEEYHKLHEVKSLNIISSDAKQDHIGLRYESSTLILCKELSLSVSESGMRDTLPDLHFVQYIKA